MGSRTHNQPTRKHFHVIGNQLQKILKTADLTPASYDLSPQDEVLIKDTWNKFVAWKHIGMEAFVARLYQEDTTIAAMLGELGDEVEEIFFGLFDLCVRQLQPHTERLGRESACPMHMDLSIEWQSIDAYAAWFANIGLRDAQWLLLRDVWQWALAQSFILEEYERDALHEGEKSAFFRFFMGHIVAPMHAAIEAQDALLTEAHLEHARTEWATLLKKRDSLEAWLLATPRQPGTSEEKAQAQAHQWLHALTQWLAIYPDLNPHRERLHTLGRTLLHLDVMPDTHKAYSRALLAQLEANGSQGPQLQRWQRLLAQATLHLGAAARHEARLLAKANEWLNTLAHEQNWSTEQHTSRRQEIAEEVRDTGTYTHTFDELEHGSRVAWRNAAKCIGRVNWNKMVVRDKRDVIEPDAMFQEVLDHMKVATAGENVEIVITVFRPKEPYERWGPRFWNTQYVRYAGYEEADGDVLGDRANLGYTKQVLAMGWQPPTPKTPFDRLPLVIHVPGQGPKMYELPNEAALEVDIEHPDIPGFAALGLKWCAIPVVCNIGLDLGGLRYTCAPFNGWFMGTEIARNLFDPFRYNKAEAIAAVMGLDTSSEQTLWRDRAFVELNVAVLHSFRKARITLVDHHTASRQFLTHDRREKQAGRECPARWSWVVPPISGSVTEVFHHEMREFLLEPFYREMTNRWEVETQALSLARQAQTQDENATKLLVLFGSESGTAENFAYQAGRRLKRLGPTVKALNDCTPEDLHGIDLLLVITSTFGDGDLPQNAEGFARWLEQQPEHHLEGLSYGVMGLGNSIYEHYCAAGVYFNKLLQKRGAYRLIPLHKGDELRGQARRFNTWLERISRVLQVDAKASDAAEGLQVTLLDAPPAEQAPLQTRWSRAAISANDELLTTDDPLRSTRFIAFDTEESGLTYEAGDHLSVYPANDPEEVARLCGLVKINPDVWFTVEGAQLPFALPATPGQVLREELDISLLAPQQKLLELLRHIAKDVGDQAQIEGWLQEAATPAKDTPHPLAMSYGKLSALLASVPSATPTFAQLLAVLPRLKPRLYSISSSPALVPEKIHLTVGVLHVKTGPEGTQPGLCSQYLASQSVGETARVLVRPSEFCPPEDMSVPMLLVGPGTGIAPLIGFLEHREAWMAEARVRGDETQIGPAWLYFGCRNEDEYLYQPQVEAWRDSGVLSRLEVAYSRAGKQKQYVQHKMRRQHKTLWRLVADPRCHIYICGDTSMADDVLQTLQAIATSTGGMSGEDALAFFARMRQEQRYFTDVWTSLST